MNGDHAERARQLVGTRFRPQGRSSELGLDCIGLVMAVFAIPPALVRRDYRLRGDHRHEIMTGLAPWFRRVPRPRRRPGDVLLFQVASSQMHLAVQTGDGMVHADALRGKVVESGAIPLWPLVAVFRLRARPRKVI